MEAKKIAVITGLQAAEIVKTQTKGFPEVVVHVLPVSVAAFIHPKLLLQNSKLLVGFNLVMVPGMAYGDFKKVSKTLRIEIVKGPRYAFDLPLVLTQLLKGDIKLSSKVAADLLLENLRLEIFEQFFESFPTKLGPPTESRFYLGTGDTQVPIGVGLPPIIVAEITDALTLSFKKVLRRAISFVEAGAHIIDIGALVGEEHPERLGTIVAAVRERLEPMNALVSVDSMTPSEIEAGVSAGAQLVFSIDGRNMNAVVSSCKDVGVIVLPTEPQSGNVPVDPKSRAQQLSFNIAEARHLGYEKIIGDLIVEPMIYPGLLNSLEAYSEFRKIHSLVPLCMGAGNVSEFADFDSVGINGVVASLGTELNVNLFLTTEASIKTRNSVLETVQGTKMAFFAKQRKTPPKDLGIDLLISKSKRRKDIEPLETEVIERIIVPKKQDATKRDERGYFRISVDYDEKVIFVDHISISEHRRHSFKGTKAQLIYLELIKRGLVGTVAHACYLGSELKKAETCLSLGKEFYQDEDLFIVS